MEDNGSTKDEPQVEAPCKCPHCGASMKMHWHRISKGLAQTLVKFREVVVHGGKFNKVHLTRDMNLTKNEYNNFQKLRYHGLVAKVKENGNRVEGYWLLTKRGNLFCKNQLMIPQKVQTFRNKIEKKSEAFVNLEMVFKGVDMPTWDMRDDFDYDFADITDYEDVTFDKDGQGKMNI